MRTFIVRRQTQAAPEDLPPNLPPLLRRIYTTRQVTCARQLEKGLEALASPTALKGIEQAVVLLYDALCRQRRILIVADFDADGATSCALAVRALRALGAKAVCYVVPNRFEYGYGLTPEIVMVAAQQQPDVLITVDNGISSLEGVATAKELGMQVLITDHHLPGRVLPQADAIVNPNQPNDDFPSKSLAGVGVIFYVLLALRARLREAGWFAQQGIPEPNLGQFLDLVALGTVADVVPLDHTNRILVEQGLKRIRAGRCVPGITALIEVAGRNQTRLSAIDIGFALGPRLNAAGRLEDMSYGIECLLCDDLGRARGMARRLDKLNRERRVIEAEMQVQALADLERLQLSASDLPFGLCLFDADWHQGIIGILAARIRERTHRPVIAFALDKDGHLKGSARSVPGLHIRDALDAVATRHPGLISKFGGHAMAAGLGLPLTCLEAFSQAFDTEVRRHLSLEDLCGRLLSDGELAAEELCLIVAEQLREAGPWGQGFPEPLFDGVFEVVSYRVLNDKHVKMVLRLPAGSAAIEAIAFNKAADFDGSDRRQVRIAYRLDINEWRGRRNPQLIVEHIEGV
jgi:single-stranded-DNA-specific exonuclease